MRITLVAPGVFPGNSRDVDAEAVPRRGDRIRVISPEDETLTVKDVTWTAEDGDLFRPVVTCELAEDIPTDRVADDATPALPIERKSAHASY